jgi:hypothetical protein
MGVPYSPPGNSPPGPSSVPKRWGGPHRKEQWWGFVANADYFGLPVTFLKVVGKSYSFGVRWTAGLSETDVYFNKITLSSASLYDQLVDLKYGPGGPGASALTSAYHEGSHAYLDLKENEPQFKKFVADGKAHYAGAPMTDGTTCRDPERLLTEAVATYVADRAIAWWIAFDTLASLTVDAAAGKRSAGVQAQLANKARASYNSVCKKADYVYGYDEVNNQQVDTARPMTAALRAFLDKEFLEDRIPDEFDAATRLAPLYQALVSP